MWLQAKQVLLANGTDPITVLTGTLPVDDVPVYEEVLGAFLFGFANIDPNIPTGNPLARPALPEQKMLVAIGEIDRLTPRFFANSNATDAETYIIVENLDHFSISGALQTTSFLCHATCSPSVHHGRSHTKPTERIAFGLVPPQALLLTCRLHFPLRTNSSWQSELAVVSVQQAAECTDCVCTETTNRSNTLLCTLKHAYASTHTLPTSASGIPARFCPTSVAHPTSATVAKLSAEPQQTLHQTCIHRLHPPDSKT